MAHRCHLFASGREWLSKVPVENLVHSQTSVLLQMLVGFMSCHLPPEKDLRKLFQEAAASLNESTSQFFHLIEGNVLSVIPVLWAEQWSPPLVWSPCWTCPATACPPPVAWSKRHCWPGSDNCLRCWGAERHLHLNGQAQQQRQHHYFMNHSKTMSTTKFTWKQLVFVLT